MAEWPSGTVTFLFTDLEGSTQRWQQYPTTMGLALARHDRLLRDAIAAHGGVVFKTVGDAVCAAFASAPAAVAAALTAERALYNEPWGETGPLRARMALHTGQAEERDSDYFGPPLNRVARLLAAGHGGQVLLSLATHELAQDDLPDEASLRDLGEHRLRDLFRPERVFQLLHPALPAAFPPLRSLEAHPGNLPVQPTPLVGRETEVAQVVELFARDAVRLLTLTGPGGVGKTRLSVQAAADLLDHFPDGAWFVDLAPLADPALVPATVASVLRVREEGGQPLPVSLAAALTDKRLLLVLDNFEQVVDAAPLVADLLAAAPGLKVLATSRTRLQLRGEREIAVPPLGLPDTKHLPPPERLSQYEAVHLFVARAQDASFGFAVTNANAPAVAAICHRLDGLPLAIELAAARVKVFPPDALLKRLETRLKVLTGGTRDLPARQRTLRDAIAWSHDLLDEAEQALFRRLAVFAGGATLEGIEAVCDPAGELDVFEGLGSLVDKSLARATETDGGEPRFAMLETIREFALERLAASGQEGPVRARHAAHFLAMAEAAEPELLGPNQVAWLARLEAEHDNLRAALGWALEREPAAALQLGASLWPWWEARGHLGEGRGWLARALGGGGTALTGLRAKALHGAGTLALRQGDYARAVALLEESLGLARELKDKRGVARSLHNLGTVALDQGDYARARALFDESLTLIRELGDERGVARSLLHLGLVARDQGDLARAAALLEESLGLVRELGDNRSVAYALINLGSVARDQGDLARAAALLEESLTLVRELGDEQGVGYALLNLGLVAQERGDYARAAALLEETLGLARELEDKQSVAYALINLGSVARDQGDLARAAALFGEGLALVRELGDKRGAAYTLLNLGLVAQEQNDDSRAAALFGESLALQQEEGDKQCIAWLQEGLAALAAGRGRAERAARHFGAAAALREVLGAPLPPRERDRHARAVEVARAHLGDTAFAEAWGVGRALSLEQALAEALTLADELARATPEAAAERAADEV